MGDAALNSVTGQGSRGSGRTLDGMKRLASTVAALTAFRFVELLATTSLAASRFIPSNPGTSRIRSDFVSQD